MNTTNTSSALRSRFYLSELEKIALRLAEFVDVVEVLVLEAFEPSSGTLILVTEDDQVWKNFVAHAANRSQDKDLLSSGSSEVRFKAFVETWSDFETWRVANGIYTTSDSYFDVFIFPRDWRKRTGELSTHYYHPIPFYLEQMAKREPYCIV